MAFTGNIIPNFFPVDPFALTRNGSDGRYDNYLKLTVVGAEVGLYKQATGRSGRADLTVARQQDPAGASQLMAAERTMAGRTAFCYGAVETSGGIYLSSAQRPPGPTAIRIVNNCGARKCIFSLSTQSPPGGTCLIEFEFK